jgi:hypothetical protein
LVLGGCSDDADSGSQGEPSVEPSVEASVEATSGTVSGVYDTEVRLVKNTCDGIEVMDNPTTVRQDGDSVSLTHAEVDYHGPLTDDGSFVTAPTEVTVGSDTHKLTVTGRFHDDGFEAQVQAEVTGSTTCGYTVAWTGTRG